MAKIIVSCRFQKSAKDIADLIRYMATREGVEKLPDTKKYNLSSSKQDDLILSVVKHFPQSKKFLEKSSALTDCLHNLICHLTSI